MPTGKNANESQFYFVCGGQAADVFAVQRFRGDDAVSRPYSFSLLLDSTQADIDPADVLNKPATLFMFRDGQYFPYSGIVSEFVLRSLEKGRARYEAVLVPRLSQLDYIRQTRIFQKLSVSDIVKQVLDADGLQGQYRMDLGQTYPAREYTVQYAETDLNFISRLMEEAGIWYFFAEKPVGASQIKPGSSAETLVITDKPMQFAKIPGAAALPFRTAGGMVERDQTGERESIGDLQVRQSVVPQEVLLKSYNYRTPEVKLTGKEKLKDGVTGSVYDYGGGFKNVSEAQAAARVAANRIASSRTAADGSSNCRAFRAGCRFSLVEHESPGLNTDYVVTGVTHAGGHADEMATYANRFSALPAAVANTFAPQRLAAVPKASGVHTAVVETGGSNYAAIDDQGRYKVRMQFDASGAKNSEASKFMRTAQPYAGPKYGMHFPAHEGTEMVFSCVDGDPDKPLGLGTVPNADTVPPVTGANKTQNILRTAGGNELLMDDNDGKQKIHLLTKAKNILEADDGTQRLFLQTAKQNQVLLDDRNERVALTAKKHTIVMDYKGGSEAIVITTAGGHVIRVDDKTGSVTIQSAAGNTVQLDDTSKSIVMTDANKKNSVTLDGNSGLILDSKGEITIKAVGALTVEAQKIAMTAKTGPVTVESKIGSVLLCGQQTALLQSKTSSAIVKGMEVMVVGQTNVKVNANMNAKIVGKMGASLSGLKVDVKGDAATSVAGAIVKIN